MLPSQPALLPLTTLRDESAVKPAEMFNIASYYREKTSAALDAALARVTYAPHLDARPIWEFIRLARRDESRNLSFVEPEPRKEAHLLLHLAHGIELEVPRVRSVRPPKISVDTAHASRMPSGIAWAHAD